MRHNYERTLTKSTLSIISIGVCFATSIIGQTQSLEKEHTQAKGSLIYVSQRLMPPVLPALSKEHSDNENHTGQGDLMGGAYNDYIRVEGKGDDILVRFKLTNTTNERLYYLATVYEASPYGYILFREDSNDDDWVATTPARGRKHQFGGGGYRWMPLPPGACVEFEFSDLSSREGEHAVSVIVNSKPVDDESLVEIISNSYVPVKSGDSKQKEGQPLAKALELERRSGIYPANIELSC